MPNFLDPCGTPHKTDEESLARWGELWSNPQIYAPAIWDVQLIIAQTTAEIADWFQTGKLKSRAPFTPDWFRPITAHFLAHDFHVPAAATWMDGKWSVLPRCASGMGDGWYSEIFISTRDPEIVPALIRWETGNCRLAQAGRTDWVDRWDDMTPDPGWKPLTNKRRSAGRR